MIFTAEAVRGVGSEMPFSVAICDRRKPLNQSPALSITGRPWVQPARLLANDDLIEKEKAARTFYRGAAASGLQ